MTESVQHSWVKSNFEQFEKSLNGESTSSLHALRRSALETFERLGFPTNRNEEWRFTNVSQIAKTNFKSPQKSNVASVSKKDIEEFIIEKASSQFLVFVDGFFAEELSSLHTLSDGVVIENLSVAIQSLKAIQHLGSLAKPEENPFNALNAAFIQDGVFISIPDNIVIEKPIYCLFLSSENDSPVTIHPRNLILAGKQSKCSVVEYYSCLKENVYFTNTITEILLDEGAIINHTKLQRESAQSFHIGTTQVYQKAASNFISNSIALGGTIARNNILSKLDGEGSECTLNGLSLATGQQLIDNHTTIDHAKPNCPSHELYKSILDQKSRGVFNGKIFVRKDAQKTDAKQTNKTLLLSDEATIDTKPQLEIFADDVKCTHGATVGQLDANQIFYLRSRGFSKEQARDTLTTAFANDVIDRINNEQLREKLYPMIFEKLHSGRQIVQPV
ncbi:MAG: Fe-S cluster assembly protein SufD [Ignavibacteriae bacterium]|nr:Fe-S cluster assembly protein SufD [Ignavibacteriota bacterium]